jgi:hypothetical protein
MIKAVIFIACATAGFSFKLGDVAKIDITSLTERQFRYFIAPTLKTVYPLPDFTWPNASGSGVSLSGAKGNLALVENQVWIDVDSNTLGYEATFNLFQGVLHVEKFFLSTNPDQVGQVNVTINNCQFYVQVSAAIDARDCYLSFDDIHAVGVKYFKTTSDNPALDNLDLTESINHFTVPHINKQIKTIVVQKMLHKYFDPCNRG